MTALIFGASGQTGHYLARLLAARGERCVAVSRATHGPAGDIRDAGAVRHLVAATQPDLVFHLAARSATAHLHLAENRATIVDGAIHVLEACRQHAPGARVFLAGSGLVFANHGAPLRATDAFAPTSAYALARIEAVYVARYYRSLGHQVWLGHLFHHESPRRGKEHVAMRIAQAARAIGTGAAGKLRLGDPLVEKEWTHAEDVARAILAFVSQDQVHETCIASGLARPIAAWAEACFAHHGLDWRDHVEATPGFVPEYRRLVGDPTEIRALGWQPQVSFAELAHEVMEAIA